MNKLIIEGLNKTYPNGVKALDDVSIEIENGIFGLLGLNGAGKSTLMRTLVTLQEADSGIAYLNDIDIIRQPAELRKTLGYLPQEFGVYSRITAYQILEHLAILKGITNSKERKELIKYLVSMNIESRKLKADTIGNETQVPINDWIDIGVFADDDEEKLMFEKRVKVNQEKMTFRFEVDSIPARAAIDPRHLLIDRIYKDNRKNISN
jgi:ABC-type Fe3+/spermidine/putrescine transport system ATPase subunit